MKHNNSNQSISGKKFMGGSIKKLGESNGGPSGATGAGSVTMGGGSGGGSTIGVASGVNAGAPNGGGQGGNKKNYMSPYSQKIAQKPGH